VLSSAHREKREGVTVRSYAQVRKSGLKTIDEKRSVSRWFAAKANWFVLFVRTYEERRVAERLQSRLDPEKYVAFVPLKDYVYKKKGVLEKRKIPWIGGYVFIAAMVGAEELLQTVKPLIFNDPTVYKLLSNDGERQSIMLSPSDKAVMTALLDENFNIEPLEAVQVGDTVEVIDGVLETYGGEVISVDAKKQVSVVRMDFMGRLTDFELPLEYVVSTRDLPNTGGLKNRADKSEGGKSE
jgi:transcription antitermination factor NusG